MSMKYVNLYKNTQLKPKINNIYTYKHKTMNQSALRLFVRSIIAEAKEKKAKDEPKKAAKKGGKTKKVQKGGYVYRLTKRKPISSIKSTSTSKLSSSR